MTAAPPAAPDRTDLTQGPVLRRTVGYALPVAGSNLLTQTYLLVDSAVVGHYLGASGMAAIGVSHGLVYLFQAGSYGLSGAFAIRIGRLKGAGRGDRGAGRALGLATTVWALACLLLTLALAGPALRLIGADPALAADGRRFLTALACGLVAVFGLVAVTTVISGRGDSRTSMLLLGLSNVANAGLVWWFVGPLRLGLAGAALATVTASGLAAGVGLWLLARAPARPDPTSTRSELRAGLRLGAPITLQHVVIGLGATLLIAIVTNLGTPVLAGVTVIVRLDLFAEMLFIALSVGLGATVAQNAGAQRPDRIRAALAGSLRLTVVTALVLSAGVILARHRIAGLFVADPAVTEVIARYILITYPFFVCYAVMVVIHGYLNALGRTGIPLVCTLLSFALVRLPASALLGDRYGVDGLIWAVVLSWVVGLGYTLFAVRRPR